MHIKTLAFTALVLAGNAFAQCGAFQLTTPPNFVANNGGAVGGAVYFTLDVFSPTGVSLCGIDINTSVAAGTPISGIVYLNQVITDISLYTVNDPTDWCPVAAGSGVSNGPGVGSPLSLSLDLAPGQYLLAVAGDFDHDYTNGNGSNETIADANLGFTGGKGSNVPFSGGLFSPRIFNATFDYDVPAAAVTTTPCGTLAACDTVGAGCGGAPAQVYERFAAGAFDLGLEDVNFTFAGNDIVTTTSPSTAIVAPVNPDLALGDDQNSASVPMGFEVNAGGLAFNSVAASSNGYIWLGPVGRADFSESEAEFVNEGARVALFWEDLNPSAGGTIHIDTNPNQVLVSYIGVFPFGGTAARITSQVEITPAGITIRYDAAGGDYLGTPLVGLTNGVAPAAAPGNSDLNGGAVATVTGGTPLILTCESLPTIGSTAVFRTSGVGAGVLGVTMLSFGPAINPGVPLASAAYDVGCELYVSPINFNLGLIVGVATADISVNIANSTSLVGLQFNIQSADLSPAITTSNGLDLTVGNF